MLCIICNKGLNYFKLLIGSKDVYNDTNAGPATTGTQCK